MISEHLVISLIATGANLALGLIIWLRDRGSRANQLFGLLSVTLALWALSNGLVKTYAATSHGVLFARLTFSSISVTLLAFLLFVTVFPTSRPRAPRFVLYAFTAGGLAASLLAFTPLIARHTDLVNGTLTVHYGPFHPFFGLYVLSVITYSLFILTAKLRRLKGIEQLQVRYVFFGLLLTSAGASVTNLIIPLLFSSSRFSPYGPLFTLFMSAFIAHSIIRYRLMNIRLVIRSGATYLLAVIAAATILLATGSLLARLFFTSPQEYPLWIQLVLVLIVASIFQPLKTWMQRWLDMYVFRTPYNYQDTLRQVTTTMASILDLHTLLDYASDAIQKIVHAEFVVVYGAVPMDSSIYRQLSAKRSLNIGSAVPPAQLSTSSAVVSHLRQHQRHLLRDDASQVASRRELHTLRKEFDHLGAEFALPLLDQGRLEALVLLGPKRSGDPYFQADIDLLSTLVSQAAIALKNATLYSAVLLANEYIENILATIDSAVIAVAADGTITLFNSAAEKLTLLTAIDVRGKPANALPTAIALPLQATASDTQPRSQLETTILDRSGRVTHVVYSTAALKDRVENILGAVGVFSDLTRVKELEADKRRAERLASVGALASGIAHEIKNPLVAIKTFAELLPERFSDEDFRTDFATVAIKEIDRIDGLVDRLRGLASPQLHHHGPLDLRVPIEDTIALLRGQLELARVGVHTSCEIAAPIVTGNSAQLKQLFLNLFINAIDSMSPPGGHLSIRMWSRSVLGPEPIIVEVSDTGTGIPEHLIPKVFDPFMTTKPHGSGLGLSICRGIADAHRATIQIRNNHDRTGTTIILEFPATTVTATTVKAS